VQKTTKTTEHDATTAAHDEMQPKAEENRIASDFMSGELRQYGARRMMMNPVAMCNKLDKMFGSGAEAIVHYMLFESGRDTFDTMVNDHLDKGRGELLKMLVDFQPCAGWGLASLTILHADPPMVNVAVKNPPIKTLKGSQKHIIGSYWAGVLSRYFNRQLVCKNLTYDAEKDEFRCTVTV